MQIASRVADAKRVPALAELALHCGGIGESEYLAIMNRGGSAYGGVWGGNVRDGTWDLNDTAGMAGVFLDGGKGFQGGGAIALAREHPDWEPGRIALVVEGSVSNFGGSISRGTQFYNQHRAEAVKIMQGFGASGSLDPLANTTAEPEPYAVAYMFKRLGADESADNRAEDSWTCMRRLADEVNWRLWEETGTIYFMTDDRILRSSVEMTIEPMMDGVISVTARQSTRRERQEITVECDARVWQARIATVAEVYGYGEPMDGRWIVSLIRRPSLWKPRTTITLQRREAALLEPAHELRTRAPSAEEMLKGTSRDLQASGTGGLAVDLASPLSLRGRIVEIAKASMTSKTGFSRYSQPGALTANPTPRAPARTDCSQWIRACYLKAGAPDPGVNTWEMDRKGTRTNNPLPGDLMLTANVGHVELYIGALGTADANTIGHGSPPIDYAHTSAFPGHFFVTYRALNNQGGRSEADIVGSSPGARP